VITTSKVKEPRGEVPGKTEKTDKDALPKRARKTWLTIASKLATDKVTLDPDA
jgi:hypothetical protein